MGKVTVYVGWLPITLTGSACPQQNKNLNLNILNLVKISSPGLTCPHAKGPWEVDVKVFMSSIIPSGLARAKVNVMMTAPNGDELACADIKSAPVTGTNAAEPDVVSSGPSPLLRGAGQESERLQQNNTPAGADPDNIVSPRRRRAARATRAAISACRAQVSITANRSRFGAT